MTPLRLLFALATLSLALCAPGHVRAAGTNEALQSVFESANQAYGRGEYPKARELYEQMTRAGVRNAEVFYNLGDTCFRMGQTGFARAWFERARRAGLDDGDLDDNLRLLRARQADPDGVPGTGALARMRNGWRPDTWAGLSAAAYLLAFLLACTRLFVRRKLAPAILAALALGLSLAAASMAFWWRIDPDRPAVLTLPAVSVRYTPAPDGSTFFTLHEGTMVRVLQSEGDWSLIQYTPDKNGWVETASLMAV